jgi:hypothetical protein
MHYPLKFTAESGGQYVRKFQLFMIEQLKHHHDESYDTLFSSIHNLIVNLISINGEIIENQKMTINTYENTIFMVTKNTVRGIYIIQLMSCKYNYWVILKTFDR